MAVGDFVCANTGADVLKAYAACWKRRKLRYAVRCVHSGALAAALARAGVEPVVVAATWAAAWAQGRGVNAIAEMALPEDAHVRLQNAIIVVTMSAVGTVTTTRRWKTRQELIRCLENAMTPRSWWNPQQRASAWELRGARVVAAGYSPIIWPTGNHPVSAARLGVPPEQAAKSIILDYKTVSARKRSVAEPARGTTPRNGGQPERTQKSPSEETSVTNQETGNT